jgi:hypothetical protein
MILEFSRDFGNQITNLNFTKIHPVVRCGRTDTRTERKTGRQTDITKLSQFRKFAEAPNKFSVLKFQQQINVCADINTLILYIRFLIANYG